MKRQPSNCLFITTLATIVFGLAPTEVLAEPISVSPNFSSPMTTNGESGGSQKSSDCGYIPETPQEVINVTERINYMRITVESEQSNPNLLIKGPDEQFCILGDEEEETSMSGVWMPGEYQIYIGEDKKQSSQYTLHLSTQQ